MKTVKFDSKASWAVAVACLFLNFLVLIPTKVSGLFFVEILDRYQVGRNLGGYPAFTITLMRSSGGPFAGYFAERFGINQVMILGSLLASVGISACFFAEDIIAVTIFLGLIHGIGLSFTNTFFAEIVTIHFRKHLTLAFGITQAGACLGSFFSPPLLVWIFQSYGTSGGFLIIGAIVLNGLPIVLILNILNPNKFYKKSDSMKSKKSPEEQLEMGKTSTVISSECEDNNKKNNNGGREERHVKTREEDVVPKIGKNLENKALTALVLYEPTHDHTEVEPGRKGDAVSSPSTGLTMCSSSMKETSSKTRKDRMEIVFPQCGRISEMKLKNTNHGKKMIEAPGEKTNELQYDGKEEPLREQIAKNCLENLKHSDDCRHSETDYKLKAERNDCDVLKYRVGELKDCYPSKDSSSNTPDASVSTVPASSYLVDQESTQQQETRKNIEIINTSLITSKVISLETNEPSNEESNQKKVLEVDKNPTNATKNAKKSLSIFLDVTYWLVIIMQSVYVFVLVIFWTTMIDFSRDKNIERSKEVYLLMALPIAEIIGRLGLGWITDREYLTRINFSILTFLVMSSSCSLMAWAQGFYVVIASIFLFGVSSGGLITVFPIIIFQFFDSANQTMGQASRYCLFGPLSFLNGPLIGYFRGTLGSYAWLYHTIAMVTVFCAALSAFIPVLARRRDGKKNKRS